MDPTNEQALRVTLDGERADEWSLVLTAIDLPHRLEVDGEVFQLLVAPAAAARAEGTLAEYDAEQALRARQSLLSASAPPDAGPSQLGAVLALLLAALFLVTGPRGDSAPWVSSGVASAELLLHGQPFRAVTALTLHADVGHLFGNAVGVWVLGNALGRWLGPGVAALALVAAGALGNTLNALAFGQHLSIGASTAVFGGVGLLAALGVMHRRRLGLRRLRALAPFAAGLALFGMLGTAKESDVLAHVFGLASGLGIGIALAIGLPRPLSRGWQTGLGATASFVVAGSWLLAVRGSGLLSSLR